MWARASVRARSCAQTVCCCRPWKLLLARLISMSNTRPGFFQKTDTETMAAQAAQGWLNNPANKMSLPQNNKAVDADGDGLLDQDEFQQLFDLDGDGNLDQAERAKALKMFALVDKDGDGQLTAEELKQVAHARDTKFKARNN